MDIGMLLLWSLYCVLITGGVTCAVLLAVDIWRRRV